MSGGAPREATAWCAALAEALSVCCAAPTDARCSEVLALISNPTEDYLPDAWTALVGDALAWIDVAVLQAFASRPAYRGMRMIEAALRDKPLPVPAWAERDR